MSEKQRKLQLHRQPAECAVLLPAAPNSQTEEQSVLLHFYILSIDLCIKDVQRRAGIFKNRTTYCTIISDVQYFTLNYFTALVTSNFAVSEPQQYF